MHLGSCVIYELFTTRSTGKHEKFMNHQTLYPYGFVPRKGSDTWSLKKKGRDNEDLLDTPVSSNDEYTRNSETRLVAVDIRSPMASGLFKHSVGVSTTKMVLICSSQEGSGVL